MTVLTRYHLTEGDKGHVLPVALTEKLLNVATGKWEDRAVALPSGTVVKLHVRRAPTSAGVPAIVLVAGATCTIAVEGSRGATLADDVANQVDYTWQTADSTFTIAGDDDSELGDIQWEVDFTGGVRRFPHDAATIELHRAV